MRLGVGSWRIRERRASGFESDFCKLQKLFGLELKRTRLMFLGAGQAADFSSEHHELRWGAAAVCRRTRAGEEVPLCSHLPRSPAYSGFHILERHYKGYMSGFRISAPASITGDIWVATLRTSASTKLQGIAYHSYYLFNIGICRYSCGH